MLPSPKTFAKLARILHHTQKATSALLEIESKQPQYSPDKGRQTHAVALNWTERLGEILGINYSLSGAPVSKEPTLFVANHVGYMDIPLMMRATAGCFVSKKEVASWPFFGKAATAYGSVFVDRSSPEARRQVAHTIGEFIKTQKRSVILFPEGTSHPFGVEWKRGAFAIAKQHNIPVQALRIAYSPHAEISYWGDDTMAFHLLRLIGLGGFEAHLEVFEPQRVENIEQDTLAIQTRVRDSLKQFLEPRGEWHSS